MRIFLPALMDELPDALLLHTPQGHVLGFNWAACTLLKLSPEQLLGQTLGLLLPHQAMPLLYQPPQGPAVFLDARTTAVIVEERALNMTTLRDISERIALEEGLRRQTSALEGAVETHKQTQETLVRREKLAALGGLVAGIAHEINTPLGVTLTAISLVEEKVNSLKAEVLSGTATRRRFMEVLETLGEATRMATDNGRRAADLVASFKKVAVDQTSEAARVVEFPAYLQAIVDSLRPVIKQAKVRVSISGDPIKLYTRPGSVAQVLTNLITNAITHGLEEHPDPHIDLRSVQTSRGLLITVEDNGWGMPEEVRKRAFEPFFTTRMGRGGSGLGLHIVYNIVVDMLGGEVELDSAPGQGTCFRILIPHLFPADDTHETPGAL